MKKDKKTSRGNGFSRSAQPIVNCPLLIVN